MRKLLSSIIDFPLHPFIIAIYIVFSLFAHNISQIKAGAVLRSLLVLPLLALLFLVILRLLLKDWRRSAILTTLYLGLLFSYGHVYHYLETNPVLGMQLGRHRILIILFIILAGLLTWAVIAKLHDLVNATRLFNLVGITLLIFPLSQIVLFSFDQNQAQQATAYPINLSGSSQLSTSQSPPDVYYIILDGYSRSDTLKEAFAFDNSAFISELQQLGFYVATCSQANYTQTSLSMTSSLNLNYLDSLEKVDLSSDTSSTLYPLLENNEVMKLFKQLGYTNVAFETAYYWLNLENVDHFYSAGTKAINPGESRLRLNGFEAMLMRQSAGILFTDMLSFLPDSLTPDIDYPDRYHREMVLYDFNQLYDIPLEIKGPKFIYSHIVAPHPPLVFGPDGEWVDLPENLDNAGWRRAYTDEIEYVNQRTLEVVREIISVSSVPPVIIIQADHGAMISDIENHPEILSAFYLPGGGNDSLYPTISPVNTFRLIFNQYFGGNYPLLDDKSYISKYTTPFDFNMTDISCP